MDSTNVNTQYELFVKEIYEYLHKAEDCENIEVQHNINLKGISGCCHQIDVYWRFQLAGVEYQVAIECKNYQGKVSIGKIRDFNSVLEDIGGINGVFVSKNGFQTGAKKYAEQKKIRLIEMRYPNDEDWAGRMRDLHFNLTAWFKNVRKRDISFDMEWIRTQPFYQPGVSLRISGMNNEMLIEDVVKGETVSIYDLEQRLPMKEKGEGFQEIFAFEEAYLLSLELEHKIKIKDITFKYDVSSSMEGLEIHGDDVAKAIVKDVISGVEQFIDIYGNVKEREKK